MALTMLLASEMDRVARNAENWQERMVALGEMQRAFATLETDSPSGTVAGNLSTEMWKTLRPLKGMVQDLRSQIVKEVCALLTTISRVTRDAMAPFLRDVLPTLVEVRGSGNKVCSTYCGKCLEEIVTHTVVKGATLRLFVDLLLDSKNALIRLCCISCLRRVLVTWSIVLEKSDIQQLEKSLQHALYDASSSCRAQAHELFLTFHTLFPTRALVVMSMVDFKIQKRLEALASANINASGTAAGLASNVSEDGDVTPVVPRVQALAGLYVEIGDRVCIPDKELFGYVRFLGEILGTKGIWVGIELDEACGKNDGSVKGRYYFQCKLKHGVFARPQQVFLTMSSSKMLNFQQAQPAQINESATQKEENVPTEIEAFKVIDDLSEPEEVELSTPSSPPLAPAPASVSSLPVPIDTSEPSKLGLVLQQASLAHRRYLNRLLIFVRTELEEHERFENYGATASSADAVQYLQQLQNSAQDKIVLSDEFIQQIIQSQQAARES